MVPKGFDGDYPPEVISLDQEEERVVEKVREGMKQAALATEIRLRRHRRAMARPATPPRGTPTPRARHTG